MCASRTHICIRISNSEGELEDGITSIGVCVLTHTHIIIIHECVCVRACVLCLTCAGDGEITWPEFEKAIEVMRAASEDGNETGRRKRTWRLESMSHDTCTVQRVDTDR